jgi:hypothetical protein
VGADGFVRGILNCFAAATGFKQRSGGRGAREGKGREGREPCGEFTRTWEKLAPLPFVDNVNSAGT